MRERAKFFSAVDRTDRTDRTDRDLRPAPGTTPRRFATLFMAMAFCGFFVAGIHASEKIAPRAPVLALEWARQFAESIRDDEGDRAKSLQQVADAYLKAGDPVRANEVIGNLDHWRAICALADIAGAYAALGDEDTARRMITEANQRGREVTGWPRDRVQMHIAMALAILGEEEIVLAMQGRYETVRGFRGQARAARAMALARAGRASESQAVLMELSEDDFYDTKVWQTRGYLQLAGLNSLPVEALTNALNQAWVSATRVPGHQRAKLQFEIADAWIGMGYPDRAREGLLQVTQELLPQTANPHLIAPVLSRCAISWGRLGDAKRVLEMEQHTEPMIRGLLSIEQPELWALWAEAWQAAGDRAAAVERIERAVGIARELKNSRPRALAGVAICLSLARAGIDDARLETVIESLQATFSE